MSISAIKPWFGRAFDVVKRTGGNFSEDELMTRAAALAFYTALSLAPLLVLLLWIVSSLSPSWQQGLVQDLNELVGPQASQALALVIENADDRPGVGSLAGWIGLAVTLFGASAVFAQLQDALNKVWGVKPRPGKAVTAFLRARMHAIGLLLTLAFLLIVSLWASTLIAMFVPGDTIAWRIVEALVSLALFALVFAGMFKVLPDVIIPWRDTIYGALLTALLFAVGKFGIGLYLDHADVGGAYGPAGALVVLLVWVFYSAVILLLGAELTEAVAVVRGSQLRPSEHAVPLRESGRRVVVSAAPPEVDTGEVPTFRRDPDEFPYEGPPR
ncbi:YihY/virulence factor BrkB family protein [Coralloluteibacterium stylophorae]|uniref:YihY/virulence factor BrkB family protein n=1 Tax=Coralloluteibacterium stylophorae TaxID=1776034 RepID=A0A8J7VUH5_9GAMM|nr:YihY/virulence factor BrkB family protein [Coralloluteibacterium stylophorae]MBS7458831.1 YihY/virulence factor BrkB family protein [Coralloluteibacterium stylophorae]